MQIEHRNYYNYEITNCEECKFVTIRESTAAATSSSLLDAKCTFKGITSPTNHFRMDS